MKISALKLAIAAAVFTSAGAMAANDGSLGTTSSGDVIVQVSKGTVVQITDLDDLVLGNWTASTLNTAGGAAVSDSACVYSSIGGYKTTLSSLNGTPGNFIMVNGAGNTVAYTPSFNGDTYTGTQLPASGSYTGNATDPTCGGYANNNASVAVGIVAGALDSVPDGNYTDVLTVLISPN